MTTSSPAIDIGAPAPDFSLTDDQGHGIALSDFRGRKLVLYFYPKAETAGCTIEANDFNRLRDDFKAADTEVLGISADPAKKLARFRARHGLAFGLAGDETHELLEAYGVWGEKTLYGRKYMGIDRTTLLIGRDGRIARIWRKVKVAGHAEEVLAAAREL